MSDCKSSLDGRVAKHISVLPKSGIREFFDIVANMKEVISLGIGEPDFVTPWRIREAAIHALDSGFTSYTSNLGDPRLRKCISNYVQDKFHAEYDPVSQILVTVGVSEALDIALRAILNPGDEVLYHEPCYVSYAPSVRMCHAVPIPVQTYEKHDFVLQVEDLEAAVTPRTRVLLLNYPNNPTGAGLTFEDKKKLADFAIRHDLIVITDEIYEELSYIPRSQTIASLPGMADRTILLNGLSKAHAMTGFRLGYACGPHDLIDAMMKIHQYCMLCASSIAQAAALEALQSADTEKDAMRMEYEQRRNVIVKGFNEMGLHTFMPRGAFYVFPNITSTGMNSMQFAKTLLSEKHVAVVPGTAFGECGEGFVRCSYATGMSEIEEALRRIRSFIGK